MSLVITSNNGGGSTPIEEGTHLAVCVSLVDVGKHYNERYDKWESKVVIQWEVADEQVMVNGEELNKTICGMYTMSLGSRSKLYGLLNLWRGKPFTDEELKRFDLKSILGAPCMLTIVHNERNGKTFANVGGATRAMKGMSIQPTRPLFRFDIDEDPIEKLTGADLPKWVIEMVKESEQYKERTAGTADDSGEEYEGQQELVDLDDSDGQLPF